MIFSRSFPRRYWTWVPWWVVLARKPLRSLVCPLVFRLLKVGRIRWWVQWANVLAPGKIALITGSSHAIFGVSEQAIYGPGFFGAITDAVVPGQYVVEGGQVSTGSIVKWFRDNFCGGLLEEANMLGLGLYELLDKRAENLPVGSDGLLVLDHWQGNRTPYTDSEARGMIWGLTLKHDATHIYRAIMEGICYGTELIFRTLRQYGFEPQQIVACGRPLKR